MSGIYRAERRAVTSVRKITLFERSELGIFRMKQLGVKVVGSLPTPKPPDALFRFVFDKTKRKECRQ